MDFIILVLHLASLFRLGRTIMGRWFSGFSLILEAVGAFLLGTLIGVPLTYLLACVFSSTGESMLWGTLTATGIIFWVSFRFSLKSKSKKFSLADLIIVVFSLLFGTWLMTKTFHGDNSGQLFVGSNNVFDFGMMIGLVRSMAWGSNIPFMSPFFSGAPMLYHFFFTFWIALWHYFGVPVVWAVNIPSILSFSALLIMIYFVPQILAKQKPWVGWVAVVLAITNSSLAFWHIVGKKDIWNLPTYPFAGPFDGSTISIFVTLNSYVNQRHLSFSIACGLLLIMIVGSLLLKNKWKTWRSVFLGILTGLMLGWNMVIYLFVVLVVGMLLLLHKQWKSLVIYVGISVIVGVLFLLPIAGYLYNTLLLLHKLFAARGGYRPTSWGIIDYLWQNVGFLPVVAGAGLLVLSKKIRIVFSPFVIFFMVACAMAAIGKRGFEQKSYSFFVIGMDMLAAIAIGWLWQRKKPFMKIGAGVIVCILTVSGVINLFPIKNEFAFPLIGADTVPLVNWIREETPKTAVFVSYADMIDPVVLAGRKNFFGFFGNIGRSDRFGVVRQIYEGNMDLAKENGISYILVPKWEKNDFPYAVQLNDLPVVFEDARFRVHRVE